MIIDIFQALQQGVLVYIEYVDLFEPPFTQFGADAATRLFSEEELQEIVGLLNSIKI